MMIDRIRDQRFTSAALWRASAATLLITAPAAAQVTSAPAAAQMAPASEPPQNSQDIVVTAQKTGAQSVLSVPMTITAYSAETLKAAGVQGLSDIAKLSPSVDLVESFGRAANYLSMRGVSSTETGTPTVQVYVDGFTTGVARGQLNTTLFDLERVEVLEGPQATLYGANAIGGVINYITRKPSDELHAELKLEHATLDETEAVGSVSGPLVPEKLFAGVSVAYHHRGGYLDDIATGENGIDSQKDVSARAALRAVLGRTTIDLSATYGYTHDGCGECSYIPIDYNLVLNGSLPYNTSLRDGQVNVNSYDRTVDQVGPHYLHRNANTEVLNIEHDFGGAVLTSITGYGQSKQGDAFDLSRAATRNPNPVYATYVISDTDDKSVSEELRLSGGGHGAFHWLIGGYYAHLRGTDYTYLGYLEPNPVAIDLSASTNYAVFANADLPLGDHVVLSGGLRYDHQTVQDNNPPFALSGKQTSNEVLPRGTAEYHFDRHLMVYATYSKGYKSGGVNVGSPSPIVSRTYAPEFLYNYEGGVKGKIFDNRLAFSLSGFHMNWTNRQVQLLDPSGLFAYQANLGKSHIDGAELTASLDVTPDFNIAGGVTYLHAKIDRYDDLSGVSTFFGVNPNLAGNHMPNAPNFRASISPQWTTPVFGGAAKLRARADVSYTGVRYFDAQNLLRQNAYTLINLYLGLERDHFEIGVFANNVTDKGYHSAGDLTTLGPLLTTGVPRMVGVRAGVKL